MLNRYWFKFAEGGNPAFLDLGCGITAYDEVDAREILRDEVFSLYGSRDVVEVIADVDIQTLEANHVRPNMGVPVWRGVWFPNLQSSGPIR